VAASEVERCFARFAPSLTADLRAQWRADLEEVLAARASAERAPTPSSSSSASSAQAPVVDAPPARTEVASVHSKIKHRILIGPSESLDPSIWIATCGWRFGKAGGGREPRYSDQPCVKCWPSLGS